MKESIKIRIEYMKQEKNGNKVKKK